MKTPRHNVARIVSSPSRKVASWRNQITRSSHTKGFADDSGPAVKRASHWFTTILTAAYVLAIIWTSFLYAAEDRITGGSRATSVALLRTTSSTGRLDVRAYVQSAAKAARVDPHVADWIVSHESQRHPHATGDRGESRGLWQINRVYHPEVSDQCAYDVECSTHWSLRRIRDGNINEWSTWKYRRRWQ